MYGAEIEFDSLTDTDRAGAKDKNFLLSTCFFYFIFTAEYRIIVRCACSELCRTGIYHLVCRTDSVVHAHLMDLSLGLTGQRCNDMIRKFDPFCFF